MKVPAKDEGNDLLLVTTFGIGLQIVFSAFVLALRTMHLRDGGPRE